MGFPAVRHSTLYLTILSKLARRHSRPGGTHECRKLASRTNLSDSQDSARIHRWRTNPLPLPRLLPRPCRFGAYLPGFELPPYIGIKSRPALSRQERTHRCRLPPALVLSPHSRNQQRQNGARRMPMAAKCAEMRHESGLGGYLTIGRWAIEELRKPIDWVGSITRWTRLWGSYEPAGHAHHKNGTRPGRGSVISLENLVWLCAWCHRDEHLIAKVLSSARAGSI
jgi:hypothetical protein